MKVHILQRITLVVVLSVFTNINYSYSQQLKSDDYTVIEELDVKVPMRDGIRLSTNIYRPDADGIFPVVLIRSPYGNGGTGHTEGNLFAKNGYVYIVQDTRGRYESEGEFYAMQNEARDGYDMQQWISQQAWCNGKIGTAGGSYVGFTQWMPAPYQHPALVCMMPAVTFSDFYSTVYQNGAFRLGLFGSWSIEMTQPYMVSDDILAQELDSVLYTFPLIDIDKSMGWRIPFFKDWLLHPERDSYWDITSVGEANYLKIKASVYNIGGWYDILLGPTIENYLKMTSDNIDPDVKSKQKLMIGPWIHNWGGSTIRDFDFGKDASVDARKLRLKWFDSQLKGLENGIMEEAPVKIFVMGVNVWRYESEWPLKRTEYRNFYFHSKSGANSLKGDGLLNAKLPGKEPVDSYVYDPLNPVVSEFEMGPDDQTDIESREDVLVYTTRPLKTDIEVTGPVNVVLYASSSAKNTDFTAKLVDVYPDGRAIRLCEGIIRASYRNSDTNPVNIEPGEIYEYSIDLWATSNVFMAGHQIRVEISSSSWPRFDRNPNTGNDFGKDTLVIKAYQTIYHDSEHPSHIILPVIE